MNTQPVILQTPRLQLRMVTLSDSSFLVRLLNDPSWLENIGDRGVRTDVDAENYIRNAIWQPHETHGYGMYLVQLAASAQPIGLCGLVKREFLSAPDLGFALLPEHAGRGYAAEAASSLMPYATQTWGIKQFFAIVKRGNDRSVRLLERLRFVREGPFLLPQGDAVELYVSA